MRSLAFEVLNLQSLNKSVQSFQEVPSDRSTFFEGRGVWAESLLEHGSMVLSFVLFFSFGFQI